jgi:diguanylate cyclase (GGDEF)-like protein/PAS domain S-box-containing protein
MTVGQASTILTANRAVAVGLLVLSLGITLFAWRSTYEARIAEVQTHFSEEADEVGRRVAIRMAVYEQVLRGGLGLFEASTEVSRGEWKRYVATLKLEENFPGIQGVGFSLRVPPADKEAHIAGLRAQGFPDYTIRPEGARDEYHTIVYLEPFSGRNLRAFGFDMASEATRRQAMERARGTGRAALSGKVTLVQETEGEVQAGVLMYLPHYRQGVPLTTQEERRQALIGYVYSPFRMGDLMGTLLRANAQDLRLEVFDGLAPTAENLLYDSAGKNPPANTQFTKTAKTVINGRDWLLRFTALPAYSERVGQGVSTAILIAGALISLLLFAITNAFAATRQRALELAGQMTDQLRSSEDRLRAVLDSTVDAILTVDERGRIETVNPSVERLFGWRAEEMIGQNVKMLMPEPHQSAHDGYLHNYLTSGQAKIIGIGREVPGKHRDGRIFAMELAVNEIKRDGHRAFVGILRDVSARKRAETEMVETNTQLSSLVDSLKRRDNELTLLNRMNDLLLACRDQGEAIQVLLITAKDIFPGHAGALALADPDGRGLRNVLAWGSALPQRERFAVEDCWALRQGRLYEVAVPGGGLICGHFAREPATGHLCLPLIVQGALIGLLTMESRDADPQAREAHAKAVVAMGESVKLALSNLELRRALQEQAIRDPLTGLFNRRYLNEELARQFARVGRGGPSLALAVIDLDHFKRLNDNFGHEMGDLVLKALGQELRQSVRRSDIPCRMGGEEFVLLMPDTDREGAVQCLDLVRERFKARRFEQAGKSIGPVTMSIGLAQAPQHGQDSESLMRAADQALYEAKAQGRDRIVWAPSGEKGD